MYRTWGSSLGILDIVPFYKLLLGQVKFVPIMGMLINIG